MQIVSRVRSVHVGAIFTSLLAVLGLAATAAPAPIAAAQPSPELATLLAYDRSAPLKIQEVGVERRGAVSIRDLTFAGAADSIRAHLVSPEGNGPFAGILYVHWLGEPATTNRKQFLEEAVALAPRGAVALLIDAMWAEAGWYRKRGPEGDFERSVRQVVDLRRALDLLLSQPGVDPARIAYVGHDFGAMYGTVMGAVDPRPRSYVLMAGTIHFSDWFLYAAQPRDLAAYKAQMAVLDPVVNIGALQDASVFFQFAATDEYVPAESALAYYRAARPRKQMATYATDHSMAGAEVEADRRSWLARELGLGTTE